MSQTDGLLRAHIFDGKGGGQHCTWDHVRQHQPTDQVLWIHMDRKHETTRQWITSESRLPKVVADALMAEDTRPRVDTHGKGVMIFLRGANMNPGAEPDDLISIRMWIESNRIITLRFPKLQTITHIADTIKDGTGPQTIGQFVTAVAGGMTDRLNPVVDNLEDQIDQIEEQSLDDESGELRATLLSLRRQAITLRRYLGPQREALQRLRDLQVDWLDDNDRQLLRELTDRTTRYVEDLDAVRDRSALMREELASRQSDRMNRTMYVLSMVATIFLPLGLITGLLGINVSGMPGSPDAHSGVAFWIVCLILIIMAVCGYLIVRWKKLL